MVAAPKLHQGSNKCCNLEWACCDPGSWTLADNVQGFLLRHRHVARAPVRADDGEAPARAVAGEFVDARSVRVSADRGLMKGADGGPRFECLHRILDRQ